MPATGKSEGRHGPPLARPATPPCDTSPTASATTTASEVGISSEHEHLGGLALVHDDPVLHERRLDAGGARLRIDARDRRRDPRTRLRADWGASASGTAVGSTSAPSTRRAQGVAVRDAPRSRTGSTPPRRAHRSRRRPTSRPAWSAPTRPRAVAALRLSSLASSLALTAITAPRPTTTRTAAAIPRTFLARRLRSPAVGGSTPRRASASRAPSGRGGTCDCARRTRQRGPAFTDAGNAFEQLARDRGLVAEVERGGVELAVDLGAQQLVHGVGSEGIHRCVHRRLGLGRSASVSRFPQVGERSAAPSDARSDGSGRDAEHGGDLRVVEPGQIPQHDRGALLLGESRASAASTSSTSATRASVGGSSEAASGKDSAGRGRRFRRRVSSSAAFVAIR